ncbi:aminotransferase class V-fold PLP-dependent enzyme, partial [Paramuricea clavata]
MNQMNAHKRPTFLVAHRYRCHGLLDRETFLGFKKTYEEVMETIATKKLDVDQDELWRYVRSLFDFDDFADCVPINAANLSIVFHPVQECMNAMASQWNRDISIQKRHAPFVYTIEAARALIASQLNAAPEDIAILRNGSDPNAVINNGLDYKHGDNIVLFDQNHPTNTADTAFAIRKLRFPHINCRTVSLTDPPSKQTIIDAFLEKVDKNTRLVSFSEVSANFRY